MVLNLSETFKNDNKFALLKLHEKIEKLNELYPYNAWVGKNNHQYFDEVFGCFRFAGRVYFQSEEQYTIFLMIFGNLKEHLRKYRNYYNVGYRNYVNQTIKELRINAPVVSKEEQRFPKPTVASSNLARSAKWKS